PARDAPVAAQSRAYVEDGGYRLRAHERPGGLRAGPSPPGRAQLRGDDRPERDPAQELGQELSAVTTRVPGELRECQRSGPRGTGGGGPRAPSLSGWRARNANSASTATPRPAHDGASRSPSASGSP